MLVLAPAFRPAVKAGGPARTLTNLVGEFASTYQFDVVAPDRDLGDDAPFEGLSGRRVTSGTTTVYYLDSSSARQVLSLLSILSRRRYDLIMVNSVWNHCYALAPVLLRLFHVLHGPILLLSHGELEPGALAIKARKKRLAGPIFRRVYHHGVSVFGATSCAEESRIASWFPGKPVVASTNNLPDSIPWGSPDEPSTRLRILFLSRVHPTKGLLPLLRALRRTHCDVHLSIVGPIEDATYWAACRNEIAILPRGISVSHQGLAPRHAIPPLLWNADCLVLLTAGENYGHVIAEALQAGCPVIATPTTPWTEVLRQGGGSIVEDRDDTAGVAAVLERWALESPEGLLSSRHRARAAFEAFSCNAGPNILSLAFSELARE